MEKKTKAAKKSTSKRTFSASTLTRPNTRKSVLEERRAGSAASLAREWAQLHSHRVTAASQTACSRCADPADFAAAAAKLGAGSTSRPESWGKCDPNAGAGGEGRASRGRSSSRRAHAQQGARNWGPFRTERRVPRAHRQEVEASPALVSPCLGAAAAPCP